MFPNYALTSLKTSCCNGQFQFIFFQDYLDQLVHLWNTHKMRIDRKFGRVGGRPVLLYTLPELHGTEDKLVDVDMQEVAGCEDESVPKGVYPCERHVFDLCCILMEENKWAVPTDEYEAARLYLLLKDRISTRNLNIQLNKASKINDSMKYVNEIFIVWFWTSDHVRAQVHRAA